MVQAGTQWWLCQWLPPSSAGPADPTPAQGCVAPEPSAYTPNPAPHPCPSHTAQLPFTPRAPLLPCRSPLQALPTHALLQTPLLPPCSPALVTRPAAVKAGWAGGGGHHSRVWQQGWGTWRTPPHLQATGLHAMHSWVPQTRFVATAASLVLKLDTQSAGGYSQHGELEVTQLELVRAPRCRDRHTRIAKRKKKTKLNGITGGPACNA